MRITVLGSCRQNSLYGAYEVSGIRERVSYPHYSKEVLQVVDFCQRGGLSPHETLSTFRTPILDKEPLAWSRELADDFAADLYVVEVASRLTYCLDGRYVHHIATEPRYGVEGRERITVRRQDRDEVEADLAEVVRRLAAPVLVVSHLVTRPGTERGMFADWLEEACGKVGAAFLNPVRETGCDPSLFGQDHNHWSEKGHRVILEVYKSKICCLFS